MFEAGGGSMLPEISPDWLLLMETGEALRQPASRFIPQPRSALAWAPATPEMTCHL